MVSNRPVAVATIAFVPTPSVDETSTGSRTAAVEREQRTEPADVAEHLGPGGRATWGLMRATASSPASMSTPAAR